jgi:predicted DsbA family dithiol-disulfide isomerase
MTLNIEVYSDVICPWCFNGKRRLEMAIASIHREHEVLVHWLSYQLNPKLPKEGIDRKDYRIRKFGSWQRSQKLDTQVVAAGESEGIEFAFRPN